MNQLERERLVVEGFFQQTRDRQEAFLCGLFCLVDLRLQEQMVKCFLREVPEGAGVKVTPERKDGLPPSVAIADAPAGSRPGEAMTTASTPPRRNNSTPPLCGSAGLPGNVAPATSQAEGGGAALGNNADLTTLRAQTPSDAKPKTWTVALRRRRIRVDLPPGYLMRAVEVAVYLSISETALLREITSGRFPEVCRIGRQRRFRTSDVERYVADLKDLARMEPYLAKRGQVHSCHLDYEMCALVRRVIDGKFIPGKPRKSRHVAS